jgi:hypothetical protein
LSLSTERDRLQRLATLRSHHAVDNPSIGTKIASRKTQGSNHTDFSETPVQK